MSDTHAKTKLVHARGEITRYEVPRIELPDKPKYAYAEPDPQSAGVEPRLINLASLEPVYVAASGEFLAFQAAAKKPDVPYLVLAKAPCGAEGDCGCGCNHGWRLSLLTHRRAVVWAMEHGMKGMPDQEDILHSAWMELMA